MIYRLIARFLSYAKFFLQQLAQILVAIVTIPFKKDTGLLLRLGVLFDRQMTVATAIDGFLRRHADEAVLHPDVPLPYARIAKDVLTDRELLDFMNRVTNVLWEVVNLDKYARVAIWKSDAPDYVLIGMAVIRAGGISVPINPGMQLSDLEYYLKYTGSKVLVTDEANLARNGVTSPSQLPMVEHWIFPKAPAGWPAPYTELDTAIEKVSGEAEPIHLHPDADVLLVHTSGTTGFPKAVICTSSTLITGVKNALLNSPMTRLNHVCSAAPNNHLIQHQILLMCMMGGIPTWTLTVREGKRAMELIDRHKITLFMAFPIMYLRMYLEGLDKHDLGSVAFWFNAADSSHEVHMRAFTRKGALVRLFGKPVLGSIFIDTFGSSEVGGHAIHRLVTRSTATFDRCIGMPGPFGVRIKVADERGRWVPPHTVGRLMVRGGSLFKGYWNAHDKLHGVVIDGYWWTGDLVFYDRIGRIYHLDREVDTIKTKQGVVYSLITEEILMNHPDVGECSVFAVDGPEGGKVAVAVCYPMPDRTVDPEATRRWLNERMKKPCEIAAVIPVRPEEMPIGLTGKVLKRKLREQLKDKLMQQVGASASAT